MKRSIFVGMLFLSVWTFLHAATPKVGDECGVGRGAEPIGGLSTDATGVALICRPSTVKPPARWSELHRSLSEFVQVGSVSVVNGNRIDKPKCKAGAGGGIPMVFLLPQDPGLADGPVANYVVDEITQWRIRIVSNTNPDNRLTASALAQTYCYYPN